MGKIKPRPDGMGWYYEDSSTTAIPSNFNTIKIQAPIQQGWVCPKCGRINAPWVGTCPCSFLEWTVIYK